MRITDRMLERTIYLAIILCLVGLIGFLYFRSPAWPLSGEPAAAPPADAVNLTLPAAPEEEEPAPPAANCTDGEKNQDETDVDCGGDCDPCAEGLACALDADCADGRCAAGLCNATLPEVPSTLTISKVDYNGTARTAAIVTSLAVTVKNGAAKKSFFALEVYIRDKDDFEYLNQQPDWNEIKPYATVQLEGIDASKTVTRTISLAGAYTLGKGITGPIELYEPGSDFYVEARLVSQNGDVLDTEKMKVDVR